MKTIVTLAACLLCLMSGCVTHDQVTMKSDSPTGKYVAIIQERSETDNSAARVLYIKKKDDYVNIYSLPVERNVRVFWAPNDNAVGILDDYHSNENRIIIVGLPSGSRQVEVSRGNLEKFNSRFDGTQYSHVYFDHLKWQESRILIADVYMYDRLTNSVPSSAHSKVEIK